MDTISAVYLRPTGNCNGEGWFEPATTLAYRPSRRYPTRLLK